MPEEFDFAELRKYLRGQIDMGDSEVFLDEPWTLEKRAVAPSRPAPASPAQFTPAINNPAINAAPSKPATNVTTNMAANAPATNEAAPLFESPVGAIPAARPAVKKVAAAFESILPDKSSFEK